MTSQFQASKIVPSGGVSSSSSIFGDLTVFMTRLQLCNMESFYFGALPLLKS